MQIKLQKRFSYQQYLILIVLLSLVFSGTSQMSSVTFTVTVPLNTDQVTIAGDIKSLGNWDPRMVIMIPRDTTYSLTVLIPANTTIEYKFTRGSWETEALTADTIIPPNYKITILGDTTLIHKIPFWKDQVPPPRSGVTGAAIIHNNFYSPELDNYRTIIVWLPPSYDNSDKRYPVLYLHDGQNVFNPATAFTGHEWELDETVSQLIGENKIREIIMVGIYNTRDRNAEYSPKLKGIQYSRFLTQTVKTFIDSTYRTLPEPQNTAVMGSSMGGLIAFHLAWEYPQIISMAACLSPAFLVNNAEIVTRVSRYRRQKKPIKIVLYNGTKGLESELRPAVENMAAALQKQGFAPEKDYLFKIIPGAEHNEIAWSKQVQYILTFFFGI